jgi:hypothetical protein
MSFNLQKDRPARTKLSELVYFMTEGRRDFIGLNEAYFDNATIKRACQITGWNAYHPAARPGQDWNALIWDPSKYRLIERRCIKLTRSGYHSGKGTLTSPRWATHVVLESLGGADTAERYGLWVVHYPPSWEWGIFTSKVRERVALAKEMDVSISLDVNSFTRKRPRCHVGVMGDFNCNSTNRRSAWFPSRYYPKHMRITTLWTKEWTSRIRGTSGRRYIDDFFHSRYLAIDRVFQLTAHEKSDHNPPLFDFHTSVHLR